MTNRKVLTTIKQDTVNKKKTLSELFIELNSRFTQKELSKKLGVSTRSIYNYKKNFFGKNIDWKITEERINQFVNLAKKEKIPLYKRKDLLGIPKLIDVKNPVSKALIQKLSKQINDNKGYGGFIIKVNLLYKFKNGGTEEKWYTDVLSPRSATKVNKAIGLFISKLTNETYIEYFKVKSISISLVNGKSENSESSKTT